ncbi:tetratricopeptide repeat protein [Lysobacter sp. SG-8]|uniref:Tetratricopeptide repeat protein n=1 Tax=Marilutibacter penaei TaxID=2759900 RepID=A0A7W3U1S2_9GAMM|nr:tetratricopeptide repeat protein [Lysobacter penaei]MBB1087319.1 tetratricopeptide repeat protein [Lysobacter penaei]
MKSKAIGLFALLAIAPAFAQDMPRPVEFYFDEDAQTTRAIVAIEGSDDATMQKLLVEIQRDPRAREEMAQLAHLAYGAGRPEVGASLYDRATGSLAQTHALWRPIHWNRAWDLYRAGDAEGALGQWAMLANSRALSAAWMPPTFALVLWSLDRKDEAVTWYAAAVRTEPDQWRGTSRYAELLPAWTDAERATLAEVQAAWSANPPDWP